MYPSQSTQLDKIENLHPTDTIATENSGTRGRSIWVHSSEFGLPDSSVPHNRLSERVGPLGTREARDRVSTPKPARLSGSRASEPGRTTRLKYDWFDPCQLDSYPSNASPV